MNKILGALQDLPANWHSQSSPISQIMTGLAALVSWQILKGSQDFVHTFSMALYHKWDVKNGFTFMLQFFSLISDGLDGVMVLGTFKRDTINEWIPRMHCRSNANGKYLCNTNTCILRKKETDSRYINLVQMHRFPYGTLVVGIAWQKFKLCK